MTLEVLGLIVEDIANVKVKVLGLVVGRDWKEMGSDEVTGMGLTELVGKKTENRLR